MCSLRRFLLRGGTASSWPWLVAMSERHPLVKRRSLTLAAIADEPVSRIAVPNVVYRKFGNGSLKSELVLINRIDGARGAIQRYLDMLG